MKKRTINIRPDDIEWSTSRWLYSTFTITFVEWRDGTEIKVNIQLDFFWLGIIAETMNRILRKATATIKEVHDKMKA